MNTKIFVSIMVILVAAFGFGFYLFQASKTRIVAVVLQDQRILFGNLKGKTLCNYYQPVQTTDPKTKKPVLSLGKGGAAYGGDGCLEINEQILTIENLTTNSPAYNAIVSGH